MTTETTPQTTFSNERKTYSTVLEGDTIRMAGDCTIGVANNNFNGQILDKATGAYVGNYSANNISINTTSRSGIWVEAAALMEQLQSDIEAKSQEGGEA